MGVQIFCELWGLMPWVEVVLDAGVAADTGVAVDTGVVAVLVLILSDNQCVICLAQ